MRIDEIVRQGAPSEEQMLRQRIPPHCGEEESDVNQTPTLTLSGSVLPPSITFCVPVK